MNTNVSVLNFSLLLFSPSRGEVDHQVTIAMANPLTQHSLKTNRDPQHDAQMDYFGKRLATCSSDRTIR